MAERGSPPDEDKFPRFDKLGLLEEHNEVSKDEDTKQASAELSSPDVPPSAGEARASSDATYDLLKQLSSIHLNPTDLTDLQATGFPDAASAEGSRADYPFSGDLTSFRLSFPDDVTRLSLGLRPGILAEDIHQTDQPTLRRFCVDLRGKKPGMHRFSLKNIPHTQQGIKEAAAAYFRCKEDEVYEIESARQRPARSDPLLIVKSAEQELVIIFSFLGHNEQEAMACFLCSRDIILNSALNMCKMWLEKTFSIPSSSQVCLLRDGERQDDPRCFNYLQEFEKLELVKVETLTLKFVCRLSQHCEKVYYIDCNDTDYVHEVKEKFLQAFQEDQRTLETAITAENVWLTNGEAVVPSDKLLRMVLNLKDLQYPLESVPSGEISTSDTFYVHFPPPGSVLVKLNFKSDSRKYLTSESVILVSPSQTTADILRREVSKVIHKDPLSFKMFTSGKKVEMTTALEPFLQVPNCTVVVEQRPRIELKVEHGPHSQTPATNLPVSIHRYERVHKLKQHVCSQLNVPGYCVDLLHKDTRLDEFNDLRSSRLRNGDKVKALVLPYRIRVRVRLGSNHWVEVVVNDVTLTTVEHLIAYVQAAISEESCRQTDGQTSCQKTGVCQPAGIITFKAVHRGQILPHYATLTDVGVAMNSRVLVLREESFCYTSSCRGRVPIFLGSYGDSYQPPVKVMAMCDGSSIYFTNAQSPSADSPVLFDLCPRLARPEGIQPCTEQLSAQFPPYSTGDTCQASPQPAEETHYSYVCSVCKSASLPTFSPVSPIQTQLSRSQSSNFHDCHTSFRNTDEPGRQNADLSVPSARLHSTPVNNKSGQDAVLEKSMDFCDGPPVSVLGTTSVSSTPKCISHPKTSCAAAVRASEAASSVLKCSQGDVKQHILTLPLTHTNSQADRTHYPSTSLVPSRARHRSECQSEGEASRKAMTRSYHLQQSVQEDKDGHIVTTTHIETSHNIPKEMWEKRPWLTQGPNASFLPVPPISRPALTEPQAAADTSHYSQPDRQFTDVSDSTIKLVATELGREDVKVMMDLIPHKEVDRIEADLPNNMFRRYHACLIQWRQSQGSKPCLDQLKQVLEENGRRDLVEAVEKNEAKIIEDKRKAIEAMEKGYATSP